MNLKFVQKSRCKQNNRVPRQDIVISQQMSLTGEAEKITMCFMMAPKGSQKASYGHAKRPHEKHFITDQDAVDAPDVPESFEQVQQ